MKTYTLKELELAVLGAASRLNPHTSLQIRVRPEDLSVVYTLSGDQRRWSILVDLHSGSVLNVNGVQDTRNTDRNLK